MLIKIANVSHSYKKGYEVLKEITYEVPENKICTFLGHNGVGKTTLFLLIAGHLKLKSGSIAFNPDLVSDRSQIAFVPESGGFFDSFTVRENLRFFYLLSDCSENKMNERISLMMRIFGLEAHEKMIGKKLSSGLRKRLSLACAIICEPKVLLLDEPTNGIDPATHELLIKILKQLKEKGTNILINSHDLAFVSKVSDVISILDEGKLVFTDSTENLDSDKLEEIYFDYTKSRGDLSYEEL